MRCLTFSLLTPIAVTAVAIALSHPAAAPVTPPSRLDAATLHSAVYARDRQVWIYTPAGYDSAAARGVPLLVAFDGAQYLDEIPLPRTLDSLIAAGRVPPLVALLVDDSVDRLGDLANRARFARFLGDELLPWLERRRNVTRDPHRVIVMGTSAGGLGAAYVAFQRPDRFGNVLSQSGAFWRGNEGASSPYEWLTGRIAASPRHDVRWRLEVGALETHRAVGTGPVFIEANRRLRDALRAKGYAVDYLEVPGGLHRPEDWGARLPAALVAVVAAWPAESRR